MLYESKQIIVSSVLHISAQIKCDQKLLLLHNLQMNSVCFIGGCGARGTCPRPNNFHLHAVLRKSWLPLGNPVSATGYLIFELLSGALSKDSRKQKIELFYLIRHLPLSMYSRLVCLWTMSIYSSPVDLVNLLQKRQKIYQDDGTRSKLIMTLCVVLLSVLVAGCFLGTQSFLIKNVYVLLNYIICALL